MVRWAFICYTIFIEDVRPTYFIFLPLCEKKTCERINLRLGARLMVVHFFFFGQNKCIIYGQEKSGSEDHREVPISEALKTLITHHFTRA